MSDRTIQVDDLAAVDSSIDLPSGDFITVLAHTSIPLAKTWQADGSITPYENAKSFLWRPQHVEDIRDLSGALTHLERYPFACIIRGRYTGPQELSMTPRRREFFEDAPHHWALIEVDNFEPVCADPVLQPEAAIEEYIVSHLPPEFWMASYHWQLSSSAGHPKNAGKLKVHIWFWFERAYDSEQLKRWAKRFGIVCDRAVMNVVQVHYTAAPQFAEGVADPVPRRSGFVEGLLGDEVALDMPEDCLTAPDVTVRDPGDVASLPELAGPLAALVTAYSVAGCGRNEWLSIGMAIHYETGGSAEGMALWDEWSQQVPGYEGIDDVITRWDSFTDAGSGGVPITGGTILKLAREAGWEDPVLDDEFEPLPEGYVAPAVASAPPAPAAPLITEALHPCSDQANANRLVRSFKTKIMVVGGRWYAWTGKYWEPNEGVVYNHDMKLSKIIQREVDALKEALTPQVLEWARGVAEAEGLAFDAAAFDADRWIEDQMALAPGKRLALLAEEIGVIAARAKWGAKSESKPTLDAALSMAKKVLEVDPDRVDADPWLFNCPNGTVDLRNGEIKPHDPADRITRMAPVEYDPAAEAPAFEAALAQITREAGHDAKPLAGFLQRWFGYCLTGSVREQKFVVHWGNGGNGKSLLLETIAGVVGEYASTAAPGLMTGEGERNLAAIADLMGRRMVTASESDEGSSLREGQVKQITGGDSLKGRHLYAQLVEFRPTHKVQLLTNHKPVIKGTDEGIWRRVLLVPYRAHFGSEEAVAAGQATYVKDVGLMSSLKTEYPGILAWMVRGAREWYCDGLREPDTVRAASDSYRAEQDRISTFINDCCELGADYWAALGGDAMFGERPSLYSAYTTWCKDCGFHPLSKPKFEAEIERAVPGFRKETKQRATDSEGKRRPVVKIFGVQTLKDDM